MKFNRNFLVGSALQDFRSDTRGNIAIIFALASIPLFLGLGAAVDYSKGTDVRTHLQGVLDAAVLAGAREATPAAQIATANAFFEAHQPEGSSNKRTASFSVADGVLTGTAEAEVPTAIMSIFGKESLDVAVKAAAAS